LFSLDLVNRTIDVVAGSLLFLSGVGAALTGKALFGILEIRSWPWAVVVMGALSAVAAAAVLRWRRSAALVGTLSQLVLAALLFPSGDLRHGSYTFSAGLVLIAALSYWRFVYRDTAPDVHAQI
jgi:hypothetical protein